jgi:nitroreductase
MNIKTVRIFEKNHKISLDIWNKIFKEISYTPSSFDLQPWFIFVIESTINKNKLKKCLIGNLQQLETSSAMVLFCGNLEKKKLAEQIYQKKLIEQEITIQQKKNILEKIIKYYNNLSLESLKNELFLELGIFSLHFFLVSQKFGYNCGYIGGCHFDKINDVFRIPKKYLPVILIAIGKEDLKKSLKKKKSNKLEPNQFVSFL